MEKQGAVHGYKLNTRAVMPAVTLGISSIGLSPEETQQCILKELEIGYRSLDTAKFYGTEASVGDALQEAFNAGLVKREELKLDYADLILVHRPMHFRNGLHLLTVQEEDWLPLDLVGCWKELEKGVELGLAKAIGVSNFSTTRLQPHAKIVPAVNQMDVHPGCEIPKLLRYCNQKGIHVTAWSQLGAPGYGAVWGTNAVLDSPVLKEITEQHGKTIAQVALRWGLDKGVGLIVKSSNSERLAQNLDLFDWTLSPEDREKIKAMTPFRVFDGSIYFKFANSPFKSLADLWDDY